MYFRNQSVSYTFIPKTPTKLKWIFKIFIVSSSKFSFHRRMARLCQCIFYGKIIPQVSSLETRDSTVSLCARSKTQCCQCNQYTERIHSCQKESMAKGIKQQQCIALIFQRNQKWRTKECTHFLKKKQQKRSQQIIGIKSSSCISSCLVCILVPSSLSLEHNYTTSYFQPMCKQHSCMQIFHSASHFTAQSNKTWVRQKNPVALGIFRKKLKFVPIFSTKKLQNNKKLS